MVKLITPYPLTGGYRETDSGTIKGGGGSNKNIQTRESVHSLMKAFCVIFFSSFETFG